MVREWLNQTTSWNRQSIAVIMPVRPSLRDSRHAFLLDGYEDGLISHLPIDTLTKLKTEAETPVNLTE